MAKVTRSEEWWALLAPAHVLRCTAHYKFDGLQCRRLALPGTNVCASHGGSIPAVQAAAAKRIQLSVDDAVKRLRTMLDDPQVEARDKIKILHDLLDRGGLGATSKVLVGVVTQDPVEKLFADLLSDPAALAAPIQQHPAALPARDEAQERVDRAESGRAIVDAVVVEDQPPPANRTPSHIRRAMEELL